MDGLTMWIVWLSLAIILIIAEILTSSAIALCMAIGCFGAFVAAIAGASAEWQIVVLVGVMICTLMFVPSLLKRYKRILMADDATAVSNLDALMGREAVVEPMDNQTGATARIKIDGDRWQVKTADGGIPAPGCRVKVIGNESIILIVEPI